jgi:hypothetical protein
MSKKGNYVTGRDALNGLYLRRSVQRLEHGWDKGLTITHNRKKYPNELVKQCKSLLNLVATATYLKTCYDKLCGLSRNSTILHTSLAGVEQSAHSKVTSLFPTIPGLFYALYFPVNQLSNNKTATL